MANTVRYPSEFKGTPNTDYLEIKMIRRDYSTGENKFVKEEAANGVDTIFLNIPQKVTESFSQNWSTASLGEMGPFLGRRNGTQSSGNANQMVQNVIKRFIENAFLGSATEYASKLGASNLNENGILSATSGVVYNPNMEVLYDGPDFRRFNFQFSLFTKSEQDAEAIYNIVRFFQYASVPSTKGVVDNQALADVIFDNTVIEGVESVAQTTQTGLNDIVGKLTGKTTASGITGTFSNTISSAADGIIKGIKGTAGGLLAGSNQIFSGNSRFIKQPPFLLLTYKRGANDHPFIRPLFPAAVTALDIDYTPTGSYTVMDNFGQSSVATVVGVNITVQLTEMKNIFKEDYENSFANRAPGV